MFLISLLWSNTMVTYVFHLAAPFGLANFASFFDNQLLPRSVSCPVVRVSLEKDGD